MYTILKQGVWTNIINDWFIKSCSISCNIIYKICRVANYVNKAKHFIDFLGKCKDYLAVEVGWAEKRSDEGMALLVKIMIEGMDMLHGHTSKIPLNGAKRHEVGMQLSHDSASNWKRQAVTSMTFGEKIPSNIYKNRVLWKCKQSEKDKILGITQKCPIMSLVKLSLTQYAGSIHQVLAKPFIVNYWTPCQLVVYKTISKTYVRLSIDATDSIVKKLTIFYYIKFKFTIFSWLMLWMKDGVSAPQENLRDFSMALLDAITRAFCGGMTIKT